ncbi:MAG TPA: hypothetical protein VNS32_02995 [Flavisolibacter sp.]|nr:hypothetical protein [Flavisolibacter sp.]
MKKLFISVVSFGVVLAASAQHGRVFVDPGVRVGVSVGPGYHGRGYGMERRIDEINREYDRRIWDVQHDRFMSHRQKRRMIRELNFERRDRIREVRRWR